MADMDTNDKVPLHSHFPEEERGICWFFCGSCSMRSPPELIVDEDNVYNIDSGLDSESIDSGRISDAKVSDESTHAPEEDYKYVAPVAVEGSDGKLHVTRGKLMPKQKARVPVVDTAAKAGLFGMKNKVDRLDSSPSVIPPPTTKPAAPTRATDFSIAETYMADVGAEGAYFMVDANANNGTAYLVWSRKPVEGAAAFAKPNSEKLVQDFKFKSGGKNELSREINKSVRDYYRAWVIFVKQVLAYNAEVVMLPGILDERYFPVYLAIHHLSGKVKELKEGEGALSLLQYKEDSTDKDMMVDAVVAIPMNKASFMHKAANYDASTNSDVTMPTNDFVGVGTQYGDGAFLATTAK